MKKFQNIARKVVTVNHVVIKGGDLSANINKLTRKELMHSLWRSAEVAEIIYLIHANRC